MQLSSRTRAILTALFVTLLWSSSWVLIKRSLSEIPPLTFAALRYTLAAMVLLPGIGKYRAEIKALTRRDWLELGLLGLIFYTITQGGQFLTLNHLEAITFSLLLNFTAVLVAVFGIVALKEIPTPKQWAGVAVFIGGVILYFNPIASFSGKGLGLALAAVTVLANAAASILGRWVNRRQHLPPRVVTIVSMGIGALVLLAAALLVEGVPSLTRSNLWVILWLAVVNTAFAFTLWNQSLQILTAVESSNLNNTMLIQIAILAWLFLGEQPALLDLVGLAAASVGIFLVSARPALRQTVADDLNPDRSA
jgi:drug/metabolite transporter (DMT)-like permease